jgi:hypothetical protein
MSDLDSMPAEAAAKMAEHGKTAKTHAAELIEVRIRRRKRAGIQAEELQKRPRQA